MAMDVIAATRAESENVTAWGHVVRTGLYAGITVLLLSLVGVLSLFNARNIIVDVLSLAYAMIGLVLIGAGIAVAKRGLFGSPVSAIIGAGVAGAIGAAFLAALAIFMTLVNARFIFINLEPKLLKLLTFNMQPPAMGAATMIGIGAAAAAAAALLVLLPSVLRRPDLGGADRRRRRRPVPGADPDHRSSTTSPPNGCTICSTPTPV